MKKYKVNVCFQSCITVEVEAENEQRAKEYAQIEIADMPIEEYNKKMGESAMYDESVVFELN